MQSALKKKEKTLSTLTPSLKDQIQPRCCHVPECGGCAFQQFSYEAQLRMKQKWIENEFSGLGGEIRPIIACEDPWRYRNKMEFSFSQDKKKKQFLGLMMAGKRGKVLDLKECFLVSNWFMKAVEEARIWWKESGLDAYHHYSNSGHLRTLTLRAARQGKGKMVILTVSGNPEFAIRKSQLKCFVEHMKKTTEDPHLSVFLQVQQIKKKSPTQFFEMLLDGPDHIVERLFIEGQTLDFKISPTSFFQPNTLQAQRLYTEGLNLLLDVSNARVFDLYCGAATLGLSIAAKAKEVVGIELNHYSVFDAKWNKEVNAIENFSIERGDVGEVLARYRQDPDFKSPDVVILDPPRSGLDAKAMKNVKDLKPKEILYISCNPKTQAANSKEFIEMGYVLKVLQPVDQFPHTRHVENITHLIFPRN